MVRLMSGSEVVDGCRLWRGRTNGHYGDITPGGRKGKRTSTHRLMWLLVHGPIPSGQRVCHSCDNRLCIEITHLFLGTQRENIQDAVSKGRLAGRRVKAKLTPFDVLAIRASSGVSQRELGRRYGVDPVTIWHVIHRVNWKHI